MSHAVSFMKNYPGNLYVVSAPSGAGKSSLVKALMEVDHNVKQSISHTTRSPRGQEKHGREYFFISDAEFDRMLAHQSFLESAEVHGNRYGTSREGIERCIRDGDDVILEIDCQGAQQVCQQFDNTHLIFILPPSWEELRARLMRRGEDAPEVIEQRLANARLEMQQARQFDFVIINESFERALFDLKAIVHAQRLRYAAQRQARNEVFTGLDLP